MSFLDRAIASPTGRSFFTLFSAGCFYKAGETAYKYYKENENNDSSIFQRTFSLYAGPYSHKEAKNNRLVSEILFWAGIGIVNGLAGAVAPENCSAFDGGVFSGKNDLFSSPPPFRSSYTEASQLSVEVKESASTSPFSKVFTEIGSEIGKVFPPISFSLFSNFTFSFQTPNENLLVRPELFEVKALLVPENNNKTCSQSLSQYVYEKVVSLTSFNPLIIAGGVVTALTALKTAGHFLFPVLSNKEFFKEKFLFGSQFNPQNGNRPPSSSGGSVGGGSAVLSVGVEMVRQTLTDAEEDLASFSTEEAESAQESTSSSVTLEEELRETEEAFILNQNVEFALVFLLLPGKGDNFQPDEMTQEHLRGLLNEARVNGNEIFFQTDEGEIELENLVRVFAQENKIRDLIENIKEIRAALLREHAKGQESGGGGGKKDGGDGSIKTDNSVELGLLKSSDSLEEERTRVDSFLPSLNETTQTGYSTRVTQGVDSSESEDEESDEDVTLVEGLEGNLLDQLVNFATQRDIDPGVLNDLNNWGVRATVRSRDGTEEGMDLKTLQNRRVSTRIRRAPTPEPAKSFEDMTLEEKLKYSLYEISSDEDDSGQGH